MVRVAIFMTKEFGGPKFYNTVVSAAPDVLAGAFPCTCLGGRVED